MISYVDTSAAAKVLVKERESTAVRRHLATLDPDDAVVSSFLLETELRRLALRVRLGQEPVNGLLDEIRLVLPDRGVFRQAGLLRGRALRSLDALHLATALRVEADELVCHDVRLLDAAAQAGPATRSPA